MTEDPATWSDWATVYAAVVASGALFLEIRRWFESGARLRLSYMLDATIMPGPRDRFYILIEVVNRGNTPTTITHLAFQSYETHLKRLLGKPSMSFIAAGPSPAQPLPHVIEPGGRWVGMCIKNRELEERLALGFMWAEVHATHNDRPTSMRLKPRNAPKGTSVYGPKAGGRDGAG